ncbi:MAG: 16S rRNA (guanine(527)-N(7))-methyltransferase RsmG [Clostridiaceae bacterium]|jgi:16S rRNA (guanine527-N7)-methyltransferase|nr:16S rRNA (guanine(527)-N(7))-methyltransferase RsmG [Clostridiaceae bacterium]
MDAGLEAYLKNGAAGFGADLDMDMIRSLFEYKGLLLDWNEKMNLTAIKDDKEILSKHFVDSLSIVPCLKGIGNLIDVGTGAGFPGIPIKIAIPELDVVLLDSLEKRVGFLNAVISGLGLEGIKAVHKRAEDAGMSSVFREKFDAATARAVAALPVLLEYCLPFVRTGGVFIAMKGSSAQEISMSGKALEILGGEIDEVKEFTLPDTDIKRSIVIVRKLRHTPTKYPRKAGKPSKEPLV